MKAKSVFQPKNLNLKDTLKQEGFEDVIKVLNVLDNLDITYKISTDIPIQEWDKGKIQIEIWIRALKKYIESWIDPRGRYDRPIWTIQKWNKNLGVHGDHYFYSDFEEVIKNIERAYNKKYEQ